ncbi:MAG: MerR family transcriptional regulator [Bacteroidales bacterium]|nr:MerR family transcriptional regulator [Bacteroidales bacterium]
MEENKSGKYYYSIGEVADMFGVNTSMIRYWENEFDVLRPRKNKKGNRLFTERDVRYVHIIYHLTKEKGYTLAGAKMALKEKFSEYEERVILLETLGKARKFLAELDQSLAARSKGEGSVPEKG